MANLSKIKREKMLEYLEKLKAINNDDEHIRAITEIENALNEKKYGLVWEEHSEKVDEILEHNIAIFTEDIMKKIIANDNEEYNFLLEGDNLHSLKLLQKTHKGKIDVIYIDPPYNTGNKDFIYDDCFVDKTDGYAHSKWLSFMEKRLLIARELLSGEGVIFISIDDNEQAQLKLLCDSIFGENNFIGQLHWKRKKQPSYLHGNIASIMEYVIVYGKDRSLSPKLSIEHTSDNTTRVDNASNQESERLIAPGIRVKLDSSINIIKKGVYKNKTMSTEFLDDVYILEGRTINEFRAIARYRDSQERIDLFCREDAIFITKNYGFRRDKLKPEKEKKKSITDLLLDWGDNQDAEKELKNLVCTNKFSYPKPVKLLKNIFMSLGNKNAIILDFFAGSGTTGHAVMQLNKEDGGNRKYILCTNNENNICEEVTYQRLKNIQSELPHNLKYFKTDFIPKFTDEEDSVSDKIMDHIRELIELEHALEIDGKKYIIISDEDKLDEVISKIKNCGKLFIKSGIFLTRNHQRLLEEKDVSIIEIPEYYFREELKEIGEL